MARLPAARPRVASWLLLFARALARALRSYIGDGCATHAAAIAYYALLSVIPLALITLSVFGLVVDRQEIVDWLFEQLPLKDTANVRQNADDVVRRAQNYSVVSLIAGVASLAWSASGIFGALRKGLNAVGDRRPRTRFWRSKLIDLGLVPLVGLLMLASITLTATARIVLGHTNELGVGLALELVTTYMVPASVTFPAFALFYRYVPAERPSWREAIAGASLAALLFEMVKILSTAIIAVLPYSHDSALYAGFGTAFILLFWFQLSAVIFLFGAEFGRSLEAKLRERPAIPPVVVPSPAPPSVRRRGSA